MEIVLRVWVWVRVEGEVRVESVVVAAVRAAREWDEVQDRAWVRQESKAARALRNKEMPLQLRHPFRATLFRRQCQTPWGAIGLGNDVYGFTVAGIRRTHH